MRGASVLGVCGALVVAATLATSAAAQDDVERTALARSLFREGVELSDAGRWEEAADRFRRSLSLHGSAVVAFNLGTALTHTGHLVEASELFRRASRDDEAPAALAQAARAQLEAVQPRLGRLTVEVTGAADTASIELDGEPMPREVLGIAALADPGHHVLRALREGEEVARAEVEVPEGGAASARLDVPPPPVVRAEEAAASARLDVPPPVVRAEEAAASAPIEPVRAPPLGTREDPEPPSGGDDLAIWIGVIAGVLVVGAAAAITTYFVIDGQSGAPAVAGNLTPAVITFE